jgi:hypothetical protein
MGMRLLTGLERTLIGFLWLAWIVYWIAAARQTAANRRTESLLTGASYRIPLLIGIILLVSSQASPPRIGFRLWSLNPFILGIAVILTVAGLSFAVWARLHLGKYWSGRITLKWTTESSRPAHMPGSAIRFIVGLPWRYWALLSRWGLFGPFLASPSFLSHFFESWHLKRIGCDRISERSTNSTKSESGP